MGSIEVSQGRPIQDHTRYQVKLSLPIANGEVTVLYTTDNKRNGSKFRSIPGEPSGDCPKETFRRKNFKSGGLEIKVESTESPPEVPPRSKITNTLFYDGVSIQTPSLGYSCGTCFFPRNFSKYQRLEAREPLKEEAVSPPPPLPPRVKRISNSSSIKYAKIEFNQSVTSSKQDTQTVAKNLRIKKTQYALIDIDASMAIKKAVEEHAIDRTRRPTLPSEEIQPKRTKKKGLKRSISRLLEHRYSCFS